MPPPRPNETMLLLTLLMSRLSNYPRNRGRGRGKAKEKEKEDEGGKEEKGRTKSLN